MRMAAAVALIVGIIGVLAVVLAMQTIYGGDWNNIGGAIAWVVIMIAFLGFALTVVMHR